MKKFKVISWHGPSNNINENSKKEILKELIEFCEHKYSDLPILIGGDFNIRLGNNSASLVQQKLQEMVEVFVATNRDLAATMGK